MAPEQVAGDDVNPGWDVWAVGVIAYEMLTAHHPFRRTVAFIGDDTVTALALTDAHDAPQLAEATAAFFRTALSTDRARRPGTALEFLGACEQVLV
jgi:serine/threonine protein kinase